MDYNTKIIICLKELGYHSISEFKNSYGKGEDIVLLSKSKILTLEYTYTNDEYYNLLLHKLRKSKINKIKARNGL